MDQSVPAEPIPSQAIAGHLLMSLNSRGDAFEIFTLPEGQVFVFVTPGKTQEHSKPLWFCSHKHNVVQSLIYFMSC